MESVKNTKEDYNEKARENSNKHQRELKATFQLLCFNNWIKSVMINVYTKETCRTLENILDIRKDDHYPLLHVLDIGCGRGQDVTKWRYSRVSYMMAVDFSDQCIKRYEERWRDLKQPFKLQTACADFCDPNMYNTIGHTYYDMVSAQLCFHYMFKAKNELKIGLASILSNLLIDGVFIATIPDSYSIMRKIKEKGKKENGYTFYGNEYFSIRFKETSFKQPFGNQYGFYLKDAVGEKNQETGEISYNNEYLIQLDSLDKMLNNHGVKIEYTQNFIEFYKKYKDEYKDLLCKIFQKVHYEPEECMSADLWEIAHLYRVLICRKVSRGKPLSEFKIDERVKSIKDKFIPRRHMYQNHHNHQSHSSHSHHKNSRQKYSKHSHRKQ